MAQYDSASIEKRWQDMWKDEAVYRFDPKSDKPVYSIDNPPRYTSGPLHLGHATGYSLIDFAARYRRMKGYNVFFPLCFDVNGTPIEVKVEKKHHITKLDTSRQEYRRLCEEYANGFIAQMTEDFKMLGESMDPSIYYQTDAPYYRKITQLSFVNLFNRGLVYKANFPVNWCPGCMTALADAEVEYRDNVNKLNYIKFMVADSDKEDDYVLVATTRPELLCTCKVVAVHPDDKEKAHLVGKELITPLYGRRVKVISDPAVKLDYGTGNVMICTIGDKDDLMWVMKYHLPMEKGIDEAGKMTELSGKYAGMPVLEAREAAIEDLRAAGLLVKQEDNPQQVSICWRCHTPIEFLQVPQWFLKTTSFKETILKRADEINWFRVHEDKAAGLDQLPGVGLGPEQAEGVRHAHPHMGVREVRPCGLRHGGAVLRRPGVRRPSGGEVPGVRREVYRMHRRLRHVDGLFGILLVQHVLGQGRGAPQEAVPHEHEAPVS